jgi:benzil reductase ((S)-benzoin forming)
MRLMRRFIQFTEGVAMVRRVINISSGAGRRPLYGWSAYCAAKAGLDMASRVAALEAEARRKPVEIVSLAPGVIDTDMQGVVRGTDEALFMDVERFRHMKAAGELRSAEAVAGEILAAEKAGKLRGDPLADLRSLGA